MGRPYRNELAALDGTYAKVLGRDASACIELVRLIAGTPLVAIASGGSSTAGEALATLHQLTSGHLARVLTPLELAAQTLDLRNTATVLFSAGGRNPDILAAFEHLVSRDPRHLFVVCGAETSPLAKRSAEVAFATFVHVPSPEGKDGYLATNSLLAFVTAIGAAFAHCYPHVGAMPAKLAGPESFAHLKGRDHLLVLFDPVLRHAAVDIESRFSESAIGTVALADYRNFAHGRHLWLALRKDATAVVSLSRDELDGVAEKTLALVPKGVPIVRCSAGESVVAAIIQSLVFSLHLAGAVGAHQDMDPGRPHVPQFGRRLYNARLLPKVDTSRADLALYRKHGTARGTDTRGLLASFVERLKTARLAAIVLDYDGTICSHTQRYGQAHDESVSQLTRLLRGGLVIGIATGRGKSAGKALRTGLPETLWQKVVIGYYNCGLILNLSDEPPDWSQNPDPSLKQVADHLEADLSLLGRVEVELRDTQVTVKTRNAISCDDLVVICANYASRVSDGLAVVRSTHSVDILPRHVNKTLLLQHIAKTAKGDILAVGDQGRWPGNDFALLDGNLALSVDSTSPSWSTCWNLAPHGLRGPAATAHYLSACRSDRHGWRVDVEKLLGKGWS